MIENSLERIIPDYLEQATSVDDETLQIHLGRYRFAAKNLQPGTVADIACGVGYGSDMLIQLRPEIISHIYAVDNNPEAIRYATHRYCNDKISFICADAMEFRSPEPLDNVVSLETIEHLTNPEQFIRIQASQLAPGGHFIASVPITPSVDINPWHLNDFTPAKFIKVFTENGFSVVEQFRQEQSFNPFRLVINRDKRLSGLRKNLMNFYWNNPGKFFLRLRSLLFDGFHNKYLVVVFRKNY